MLYFLRSRSTLKPLPGQLSRQSCRGQGQLGSVLLNGPAHVWTECIYIGNKVMTGSLYHCLTLFNTYKIHFHCSPFSLCAPPPPLEATSTTPSSLWSLPSATPVGPNIINLFLSPALCNCFSGIIAHLRANRRPRWMMERFPVVAWKINLSAGKH